MLYDSAESKEISTEIRELKELVLGMNKEDRRMKIRELERKPETTSTAQPVMK